MKYYLSIFFVIWQLLPVLAQLNINECYELARLNYPLIKQMGIIEQSTHFTVANANKGYLPQVILSAKATYQSEVIELPFNIPNYEGPTNDQYQATLDINQIVYDGGTIAAVKTISNAAAEADKSKVESDLYAIKDRINQLYFGILLLKEQTMLLSLTNNDMNTLKGKIESMVKVGMAVETEVDVISVEQHKLQQREIELVSSLKAYKQMLSLFIAKPISDSLEFSLPIVPLTLSDSSFSNRPEMRYYAAQQLFFEAQKKSIRANTMPKVSLFLQAGYGKPGFNMLGNEFSPFYIGGVRLSWNLSSFYTQKNDVAKLNINAQATLMQQELFTFNTTQQYIRQNEEAAKMKAIMEHDQSIVMLKEKIATNTQQKFERGIASATDVVRELNSANLAKQEQKMHELQYIQYIYQLKQITN